MAGLEPKRAGLFGGARRLGMAGGATSDGCDETRKLTRFLLFGLTWSQLRPTVTVRNRYSKRRTGRGADECHLNTPRHSAPGCVPSVPSRDCPCTVSRRSHAAGG